jgi:predicted ferric reductase
MNVKLPENIEYESTIGAQTFLLVLLATVLGILTAVLLFPYWMPNLANSLLGSDPKAFWYLARGSAFVAMSLLWLSMALGLTITNKMARIWPGAPAAFVIHEYVNLLGLAFSIFHGLILLGDHYIKFDLLQIVIPFFAHSYKPLLVGYGQISFYVWLIVALSFYIRSHIGPKTWRALHYLSFFIYIAALFHGLTSGTDTSTTWGTWYYWLSGGSVLFLAIYRILIGFSARSSRSGARRSVPLPEVTHPPQL